MRGRITAITTPDLAAGFQLAGVEAFSVHCAAEAEEVLRRLFKEGGASLVIVHQDLLEDFENRPHEICSLLPVASKRSAPSPTTMRSLRICSRSRPEATPCAINRRLPISVSLQPK